MKKRILTVLLVCLVLCGCGEKVDLAVSIKDKSDASVVMRIVYLEPELEEDKRAEKEKLDKIVAENYSDWEVRHIYNTWNVGVELTAPKEVTDNILKNLQVEHDGSKTYYILSGTTLELGGAIAENFDNVYTGYSDISVTFKMPGKIESSSHGEIDDDEVTINPGGTLRNDGTSMYESITIVSMRDSFKELMIKIAVSIVVIGAIITGIIIYLKKKRKKISY